MTLSNRPIKLITIIVATVAYFGLALWSRATWVDPRPKGKIVIAIKQPFETFPGSYMAVYHGLESLSSEADSAATPKQSPVLLYEGKKLLGPPHSKHWDIATRGEGRYSHWQGQGLVFSTSDNSDPNTNHRLYWVVVPN